jgi:hypothetical protein
MTPALDARYVCMTRAHKCRELRLGEVVVNSVFDEQPRDLAIRSSLLAEAPVLRITGGTCLAGYGR